MKLQFNLLMAVLLMSGLSSCARMGMTEKLGAILVTGGTSGAIIAQQQQGSAAIGVVGGAAAGAIPAAAALIVNEAPATAEQIAKVQGRAERVITAMSGEHRERLRRSKVRYIAVEAPKSANSRGTSAVMVYDIEKHRVAEPTVFDVRVAPKPGSLMKFDTYVTEYVGTGDDTSFLGDSPQAITE